MTETTGQSKKLWGGRFTEPTDRLVEKFNASIAFDITMYKEDIEASRAYVRMQGKVGMLDEPSVQTILKALGEIEQEIDKGELSLQDSLEDVHMHVEHRLIELVGDVGKRLHTGRSRNDQVATDIRLWLRNRVDEILGQMVTLMDALLHLAEKEQHCIMPGFTHLQVAQPISFGHHILAWFSMMQRDYQRLIECRSRVNCLPLGSAALAGTGYPVDRDFLAAELGFEQVIANSLDAVSDRDFAIEFCSCAAICMMHLSRWSEELVLWSSQLVGFIELPDAFCTGSSIMPQKKNPDIPELVRGKSARVFGDLQALLTLMKSQPLAYNKDNQEDKPPLFATAQTLFTSLQILTAMIPGIQTNPQAMQKAFAGSYANATDLADYLVHKGVAFRDAHEQAGKLVQYALQKQKELQDLSLDEIQSICSAVDKEIYQVLKLEQVVASRKSYGGTSPEQVARQLTDGKKWLGGLP